MQLEINTELQSLIPPLSADEYSRLEKSIVAEGCRDAIVVWNGMIVDGHNRYEICTRHGIEFAIDTLWHLPSGQWISIQEKYRSNDYYTKPCLQTKPPYPDFTQEYKNACGTQHENNGEWFKLAAQLYFYGWANAQQTGFAHWIILNVARYKGLVEKRGGLHKIGVLKNNKKHGAASFYAISEVDLKQAIVMSGKA